METAIWQNFNHNDVVLVGISNTNNQNIINAFRGKVDIILQASNMQEAVKQSYALADKEDAVLLSPACASFDLFTNYEDRGIQFKQEVRKL